MFWDHVVIIWWNGHGKYGRKGISTKTLHMMQFLRQFAFFKAVLPSWCVKIFEVLLGRRVLSAPILLFQVVSRIGWYNKSTALLHWILRWVHCYFADCLQFGNNLWSTCTRKRPFLGLGISLRYFCVLHISPLSQQTNNIHAPRSGQRYYFQEYSFIEAHTWNKDLFYHLQYWSMTTAAHREQIVGEDE